MRWFKSKYNAPSRPAIQEDCSKRPIHEIEADLLRAKLARRVEDIDQMVKDARQAERVIFCEELGHLWGRTDFSYMQVEDTNLPHHYRSVPVSGRRVCSACGVSETFIYKEGQEPEWKR